MRRNQRKTKSYSCRITKATSSACLAFWTIQQFAVLASAADVRTEKHSRDPKGLFEQLTDTCEEAPHKVCAPVVPGHDGPPEPVGWATATFLLHVHHPGSALGRYDAGICQPLAYPDPRKRISSRDGTE